MKKILFLICLPFSLFAQDKLPYYDIDLIKQFYQPSMITEDGGGIYSTKNFDYKVTIAKKYTYDERASYWDNSRIKTMVVLFKNVPINKTYEVLDCHACSGFVGLAKYQFKNNKWSLQQFTNNCNCGSASYGKIVIPKLEEIEGTHFLVYKSYYSQHGVSTESVSYHNTHNFNKALHFILSEDNGGQAESNSPEAYAYSAKVRFFKNKAGNLQAIYNREGKMPSENFKSIKNAEEQILYLFDYHTLTFSKQ